MADVLGQVAEVDAEADHRRLVADVRDAVDRARRDVRVAQVALDPLRRRVEVAGALAVRRGQQRVDHAHAAGRPRSSASTTCEPMKPAPPVTRIVSSMARAA